MDINTQPANEVAQPEVVTEPVVVTKPSNNWLKMIVLIVLGIGLLAGAVYGGMEIAKLQAPDQKPMVLEPTVVPTPMEETSTEEASPSALPSEASPSADWETYTNTENNYSVQYPKSFLRLICPDEELTLTPRRAADVEEGPLKMETCARGGRYSLEIKTFATNQAIPMGDSQFYTIDEKTIILGGRPAKQFTYTFKNNADGPYPAWYTIVRADSNGKTIEVYYDIKDSIDLFDQILATFKFTN